MTSVTEYLATIKHQRQHQVKGALDALVNAIPVVNEAWETRQAIRSDAQQTVADWWASKTAPVT